METRRGVEVQIHVSFASALDDTGRNFRQGQLLTGADNFFKNLPVSSASKEMFSIL